MGRLKRAAALVGLAVAAFAPASGGSLDPGAASRARPIAHGANDELSDAAERALAVLAERGDDALPVERQTEYFELGQRLIDAGRRELAAELQVALHAAVRAEWSVINASLTLGDLGRVADADALLAAQLERTPRAAELWNRRALLWLGVGEIRVARRHLARAVRYGSENAGLSLARLALLAGDRQAARAAFRPGLGGAEPHAWALRGWAATLLVDAP